VSVARTVCGIDVVVVVGLGVGGHFEVRDVKVLELEMFGID